MVIVVTQSWSDLIPFVRTNSDYILVAAETSEKVRKEMHINWFSSIENMDQYHDMFKHVSAHLNQFQTGTDTPGDPLTYIDLLTHVSLSLFPFLRILFLFDVVVH